MSDGWSSKGLIVLLKGTSILATQPGQASGYMPFHLTLKDFHTTYFVNTAYVQISRFKKDCYE